MFRQFVKNGIRKDENGYYCSLCKCSLENEAATLSHCSPSNEFHNLSNLKRSFTVDQLPRKSEIKFKSLVYNYILKIDPFGYRCDICNCLMEKISQALKHIKDARHVIEMNYKNINRFPECDSYQFQYVCKLCNVRYKEKNPYKLHINGKRHSENLELALNMLEELKLNEHEGKNSSQKYRYVQNLLQGLSRKQDLSEKKYSPQQNLPKKQDSSKGQSLTMGHNFTKPLVTYLLHEAILKEEEQVSSTVNNSIKRILEDSSQKLEHSNQASHFHRYCEECNLNIYGTKEKYTLHLCGILHKSKLLLKKQQTQIQKSNRFCQFCNVQLSCQETLDNHLEGKSHLKNLLNSSKYGQEFDIESVSMLKFSNKLEKYACVSCDSIFPGEDAIIDHYFHPHNGCVAHTFFKETLTNGLDTFQCSLCNIHSSGTCDFLLHAQGRKHTQRFLSEQNLFKMNVVDYNSSVNGNHNEKCSPNATQLAHNINSPTIFICSFCDSSFSNKNSSLQHIDKPANGCSISSLIKVKKMKLFCVICSIEFDIDFNNLKQHLQSKRHGQRLSKLERTSLNNVDGQLLGKQILTENVHFLNHENSKNKTSNDVYPKHESLHLSKSIANTTTKYNCCVCNVTAYDDLQLLEHINGPKHKSILLTLPQDYVPYIYCPFCHIDIFEDESMTNHFESAVHKNRLSDHSEKAYNISQTQNLFDSLPGSKTIVDELCSGIIKRPRRPDMNIKKKDKVRIHFDSNYSRIFLELGESNIFNVDQDKLLKLKLGTGLAFLLDNERLCLVCYLKIPNNLQLLYEHFLNVHHIRKLDKLLQEDSKFENFRDQFSDLALAKEFMKEVNDTVVFCFACNREIRNNDNIIREHANNNRKHKIKSLEHKQQIEEILKAFTEQLHNAWYIVQRFSCQLCNVKFEFDIDFAEHLGGKKHSSQLNKLSSKGNQFSYDLCIPCASMSLGISDTYTMHCEDKMHKYLLKSKDYSVSEMIKPARSLLSNVEEIAKTLVSESDVATSMGEKINQLLKSLEQTVESYYPEVKAYLFGSRASNLAFFNSDVDVFLDCGHFYNGVQLSSNSRECLLNSQKCFQNQPDVWDLQEVLLKAKAPIIKLRHRELGLNCDVSFASGISVEKSKIVKLFIVSYPPCRQMVLYFKKWLKLCSLTDAQGFTTFGVTWLVIFYLQQIEILPSVSKLKKSKSQSKIINGWKIISVKKIPVNQSSLSLKELIEGFFEFYANYDYRSYVMNPLMGISLKKLDFTDSRIIHLPVEMKDYISYVTLVPKTEIFRIDSPLCLQDPIDLTQNITRSVSKLMLRSFIQYCRTSAEILSKLP